VDPVPDPLLDAYGSQSKNIFTITDFFGKNHISFSIQDVSESGLNLCTRVIYLPTHTVTSGHTSNTVGLYKPNK
jgi:hypothetical protein